MNFIDTTKLIINDFNALKLSQANFAAFWWPIIYKMS